MNLNTTLRPLALTLCLSLAATTALEAQTIVYDNINTSATAPISRLNSDNPIFGDALNLSQGGTLTSFDFSIYNSSLGGNTGFIYQGTMVVKFYDNTSPYSGGTLNKPLLGVASVPVDLYPWGGLDPDFYLTYTFDATGLGIVLPPNIFVTQQFTQTDGDSTRNGIVLLSNSTVGSSPATFYHKDTSEGLITAGSSQAGYQIVIAPIVVNHRPVADPQTLSLLQDNPLSITLTASDADSDPLTFNIVTQPTNGTLSGTAPNVVYQPNFHFTGGDSFTFAANDGQTDSVPAVVSITVGASAGLVITPVFDSTITSDPSATAIMNTINTAIQSYESRFSDPINVTITFKEMSGGLGQSQTFITAVSYSSLIAALAADSKTANDTIALAHIPGGSISPVDATSSVRLTTANARALGFNINPGGGQSDSTISVNMSIINITRTSIDPGKYDLQAVVSHEIDEALGSGSGLTRSNSAVVDLFRYSATGARNYTTFGDDAYFSIDGGVTDLVRYNQNATGDYGDWWSLGAHTPRVQDAFGTPAATPNLGVELTVLDVIGYDRYTPPSPPPVFQAVSNSNGTISFSWSAVAGRQYQVQYSTNLSQTNWNNLGAAITAGGATVSASDSITTGGPQRFYRVALLPLPESAVAMASLARGDAIAPLTISTNYFYPMPAQSPEKARNTSVKLPAKKPMVELP